MPPGRSLLLTPLTEPPGDLARLFRAQELVDPARAEPRGGRDLADRQPRLMGLDDGPDPLPLGLFEPFRGQAEAGSKLLLASNPLAEGIVGLHPFRIGASPSPCPANWTAYAQFLVR